MTDETEMLEGENLESIETRITMLQAKKQAIIEKRRKECLVETRRVIALYGFTARELHLETREADEKAAKVAKPVTYRNEAINREWDGELTQKGRKPDWIKKAIEDGTIEQFRVTA
jgi:DNA-binding protein H-NS